MIGNIHNAKPHDRGDLNFHIPIQITTKEKYCLVKFFSKIFFINLHNVLKNLTFNMMLNESTKKKKEKKKPLMWNYFPSLLVATPRERLCSRLKPFNRFWHNLRECVKTCYCPSRDSGGSTDVIIPLRSKVYNGVTIYLIRKIRNSNWKVHHSYWS